MKLSVKLPVKPPNGHQPSPPLSSPPPAPQTSDNSSSGKDRSRHTAGLALQEVDNGPKEKVVDAALSTFKKAHKDTKVAISTSPWRPAPSA